MTRILLETVARQGSHGEDMMIYKTEGRFPAGSELGLKEEQVPSQLQPSVNSLTSALVIEVGCFGERGKVVL